MDWMLVHLYDNYITSNTFKSPDSKLQQDVTGFLRLTELRDGEVWIFSKHPQMGFLTQHLRRLSSARFLTRYYQLH